MEITCSKKSETLPSEERRSQVFWFSIDINLILLHVECRRIDGLAGVGARDAYAFEKQHKTFLDTVSNKGGGGWFSQMKTNNIGISI